MSQTPKKIELQQLRNKLTFNNFDSCKLVYAHDPKANKWVAVDATSPENFVEDFQTEEQALAWLNNRELSAEEAREIVNDPELESKTGNIFKELDEEESFDYRAWARENYSPGDKIYEVWHPEVQDECRKINEEHSEEKIDWDEEFEKAGWTSIEKVSDNHSKSDHAVKMTEEELRYVAKLLLNDKNAPIILRKKYFMAASTIDKQKELSGIENIFEKILRGL